MGFFTSLFNRLRGSNIVHYAESIRPVQSTEAETIVDDTAEMLVIRTLRVYNDVGGIVVQWTNADGLQTARTSVPANLLSTVKNGIQYGYAIPSTYFGIGVRGIRYGNDVRTLLQCLCDDRMLVCSYPNVYRLADNVTLN